MNLKLVNKKRSWFIVDETGKVYDTSRLKTNANIIKNKLERENPGKKFFVKPNNLKIGKIAKGLEDYNKIKKIYTSERD